MREVIIFYAGALAKTGHRSIETTTERPGSRLYGREDTPIFATELRPLARVVLYLTEKRP